MSSKAKLWLVGVVALGVALVGGFISSTDRRPDDVLIKEALAESIEASKEGRPGGVMEFISNQLTINSTGGISKATIAKWIKDSKPDVKVLNQDVKVGTDGKTAELVSDVTVNGELGIALVKQPFARTFTDVRMTFQKEDGRKYLVFPTKVWRLTAVEVPSDQLSLDF